MSRSTGIAPRSTNLVIGRASNAPGPRPDGRIRQRHYAREELVAEMASAFACASLSIKPTVRHADYIGRGSKCCATTTRQSSGLRARQQGGGLSARLLGHEGQPS